MKKQLMKFKSLSDIYSFAADMVNTADYQGTLDFVQFFDYVHSQGLVNFTDFTIDENEFVDLYCASRFIKATALVNLNQFAEAMNETDLFIGHQQRAINKGIPMPISAPLQGAILDLQKQFA